MNSFRTSAAKQKLSRAGACLICACFLILGFAYTARSASPPVGKFLLRANLVGDHFAIADFDGDKLPDLATVSVNGNASSNTSYSIRLRMSGNSEFAFGINAPWGGLQISPRDVNGDDSIDLVVTAALDSRLLGVLVNDGHGNFTFADPDSFPLLQGPTDTHFQSQSAVANTRATLCPSRSTFGERKQRNAGHALHAAQSVSHLYSKNICARLTLYSRLGRAPPTSISLS